MLRCETRIVRKHHIYIRVCKSDQVYLFKPRNRCWVPSNVSDETKRGCYALLRTVRSLRTGPPHYAMCSFSIELSDDIRGERLRFVEAMKEATAINVQSMVSYCSPVITIELTVSV